MNWKFSLLVLFTFCVRSYSQTQSPVFVHPLVDEKMDQTDPFSCLLVLKVQDPGLTVPDDISKAEKSNLVFEALNVLAETTQAAIIDSLDAWNIPYRSFYIANVIQAMLDSTTVTKLKFRNELQSILPDFPLSTPSVSHSPIDVRRMDTLLHWGIGQIRADSVWNTGITGKEVVVAGLDTGVEWDHDFLSESYRGNQESRTVDHNYNWHDAILRINPIHKDSTVSSANNPCGLDLQSPCDDDGHGTLTMGLMTGISDGQHTGIAPGARWIGARVMERGYGHLSTYLSGLEWCLAPTDTNGLNPRPDLAPDIINNSWGCPRMEGCIPENYWILDSASVRLHRAGIFVLASAGNDGREGCSSLTTPLAVFPSVFTVGATDIEDSISAFSSRGPTDETSIVKPEVVAPGQGITSIYPGGKFRTSSGTSISGPITAGVAALILEANPALRGRPDLLREILIKSAIPILENPCDEARHPNPVYGYGRIDALGAVQLAREYYPTSSSSRRPSFDIRMFPNPVREILHLRNQNIESARIIIFNTQGQPMNTYTLREKESREIEVSKYHPGIYFVQFTVGLDTIVLKLVKID